jgi:hypothetical protein
VRNITNAQTVKYPAVPEETKNQFRYASDKFFVTICLAVEQPDIEMSEEWVEQLGQLRLIVIRTLRYPHLRQTKVL